MDGALLSAVQGRGQVLVSKDPTVSSEGGTHGIPEDERARRGAELFPVAAPGLEPVEHVWIVCVPVVSRPAAGRLAVGKRLEKLLEVLR